MTAVEWTPPGPGTWQHDAAHQVAPLSRWMQELFVPPMQSGWREAMARYGAPIETVETGVVNGWMYARFKPVGAPDKPGTPPPKLVMKALIRLHPELRRRNRAARRALASKIWREDARNWRERDWPALHTRLLDLQSVDPSTLDDAALQAHLASIRRVLSDAVLEHFRLIPASVVPVGDWLVHLHRWTGCPLPEALGVLRGSSPASLVSTNALSKLAAAIRRTPAALTAMRDTVADAGTRVARLRSSSPDVARAWDAFVAEYGERIVTGFDVTGFRLIELPHALLSSVASSLASADAVADGVHPGTPDVVRAQLPATAQIEYDGLLAEAQAAYGLVDEHNVPAFYALGLLRRAGLEAGRRLQSRGALAEADHIFETTADEADALLRGSALPRKEELEGRVARQRQQEALHPPIFLGEPSRPVPAGILPGAMERITRAVMTYAVVMFGDEHVAEPQDGQLTGHPASGGRYQGQARLVRGPADFDRITKGDVLVARTTSPTYNVVLPLLGAVVTDRGGALCHAAVVAREFGIPAVVGTREATVRIPDGAHVIVDGDRGTVEIQT